MDCDEALLRLKSGNERFARGTPLHPHENRDWRRVVAHGHRPFAVILGCSDCCAPPELLFDQGLGDLFVIRVAGHVAAPDVLGSLQYAGAHLGVRLFVVLGHEHCGVVRAAVEEHAGLSRQAGLVEGVVQFILPALKEVDARGSLEAQVAAATEAHVRNTVRRIAGTPEARKSVQAGFIRIVGSVCEPDTGRVRFLD